MVSNETRQDRWTSFLADVSYYGILHGTTLYFDSDEQDSNT